MYGSEMRNGVSDRSLARRSPDSTRTSASFVFGPVTCHMNRPVVFPVLLNPSSIVE
jgi:hypothetical protein